MVERRLAAVRVVIMKTKVYDEMEVQNTSMSVMEDLPTASSLREHDVLQQGMETILLLFSLNYLCACSSE